MIVVLAGCLTMIDVLYADWCSRDHMLCLAECTHNEDGFGSAKYSGNWHKAGAGRACETKSWDCSM